MNVATQHKSDQFVVCRDLSPVEMMQHIMNMCQAGHHGSTATTRSAQEALDMLNVLITQRVEAILKNR